MHENHASIVALHRLKTFFKKSAETFASTQYIALYETRDTNFYLSIKTQLPEIYSLYQITTFDG